MNYGKGGEMIPACVQGSQCGEPDCPECSKPRGGIRETEVTIVQIPEMGNEWGVVVMLENDERKLGGSIVECCGSYDEASTRALRYAESHGLWCNIPERP